MRVLLFAGGALFPEAFQEITEDDVLIGVDSGAWALLEHGFSPDAAIGDFDSVTIEQTEYIIQCSKEVISCDAYDKDKTDTEMGLEFALDKKPDSIKMFGVTGSRLDHTLANLHLLEKALEKRIETEIIDQQNKLFLVADYKIIEKDTYSYVSILPMTEKAEGVTLKGFLYPLNEALLLRKEALGISNKIVNKAAEIVVKSGLLLVIKSRDGKE
ncbi:thiamine diphosphokinase [Alteribacillus bidgolensis]|uniref:Thiamine diphosphokinase n=1 Tax=Alteribacillus bidgolensis TaxID=930129 RepID=A0A1G8L980_9BACI|nr:thiamine diphosphokinase [Alteribacillus bidgolensis]SDI51790.1 thiamine diphosphokinase [Alteribacillus bidgolensis]